MGHASAEDTFTSLKEGHKNLVLVCNPVQVSMNGPNVNWKAVEIIEDHQKIQDPNCRNLIVIGSCGYMWNMVLMELDKILLIGH